MEKMVAPNFQFDGNMRTVAPIFYLIWLLFVIGAIIGWIVFLVAVWRGMRAHESIAESMRRISEKQER
jgi:hypothetical protein